MGEVQALGLGILGVFCLLLPETNGQGSHRGGMSHKIAPGAGWEIRVRCVGGGWGGNSRLVGEGDFLFSKHFFNPYLSFALLRLEITIVKMALTLPSKTEETEFWAGNQVHPLNFHSRSGVGSCAYWHLETCGHIRKWAQCC